MSLIMSRFCSVNQKHTEQFVLSDSGVNDFNESVLFNEYARVATITNRCVKLLYFKDYMPRTLNISLTFENPAFC